MSTVEYTWRDSELRSPPLRALNGRGAWAGPFRARAPLAQPVVGDAAAAKLAGSDDFGATPTGSRSSVSSDACEDEAELTTFGRLLVSKMLAARWPTASPCRTGRRNTPRSARSASTPLDHRRVAPDGHQPALHAPRARSRGPAAAPVGGRPPHPPPTLEEAAKIPRIAQTAKDLDGLMKLNPPLKAMHPFGATVAEECVSLFMYDVRTLALETQAHVPSYARWLGKADMDPAYAQHRLALQTLQSRQPTERWILKTPNHLWHLEALLAAYPDARIIWTHRDPGPVVTSLASLANAGQRPSPAGSDPRPTAEEWKRKCAFALNSAMAFDEKVGRRLVPAPPLRGPDRRPGGHGPRVSTASFGEEVGSLHARRMHAFLEDRPKDLFGGIATTPPTSAGPMTELAEEFRYTERYTPSVALGQDGVDFFAAVHQEAEVVVTR
jgi:hypothetical protein